MENQIYDPLGEIRNQLKITRRQLLPLWMKIFLWIFLVIGGLSTLAFLASLFGMTYSVGIYGLNSNGPLNPLSFAVTLIYLVKAITAFAFWTEKDWAIEIAFLDAIVGIAVCCFMIFIYPFMFLENGFHFNLRLELIALIPYLIKLDKIKVEWKEANVTA